VSDLQEVHAEPAERKKVLKLLQRVAAQQAADDAVLQAGGIPSATATYDVTDDLEGIDDSHEGEEQDLSSDSEGEDDGGGESSADEQPGSSMSAHDKAGRRSIAVTPGARGRQRQARGKTSDTAKGLKLSRATIDRLVAKVRWATAGSDSPTVMRDLNQMSNATRLAIPAPVLAEAGSKCRATGAVLLPMLAGTPAAPGRGACD
jgi:hypothetical protein